MSIMNIKLPKDYFVFNKDPDYAMSQRALNDWKQISEFIQWGRRNPVLFCEEIFGIEFLDYQKYVFMNTWTTPYNVWCCGRSSGKTTLGAIYLMAKTLLVPNHKSYILCGVGSQSIEMFTKIEQIATNAIPSFKSLTDVFLGELVKSQANTNGFSHDPASHKCGVYNNSQIFTLNGSFDNNRSK